MEDSCKDCVYTTCARLHSYVPKECKLSDGKPCQECVEMAKLDSQISQVHSQLVQLTHKRHALKTKINQRHEPFIHRLPCSVSSQIFEDYVHQVHSDFDPKEASDSTHTRDWSPALFLSSICMTWRKIAFATSEIWRFINIPLREDNPDEDLKIELLDEYVERSRQRTLFIGVFQFQMYENPSFSQLEKKLDKLEFLFQAIKKIACRSEEITLWGLPSLALQHIIPTDTPNLTMVRIAEYVKEFEDMNGPVGWNNGDVSLAGPLLKILDFGYGTESLLDYCKFEWDTITTVTMSALNVEEGIDILREALCLTSCSFIFADFEEINPVHPPIVNSTLEKLHVDFSNCRQDFVPVETFANSIALPSLRELSLLSSNLLYMMPLFQRSRCQIRRLSLTLYQNIPEDHVLMLLSILPSVEHFALETSITFPKSIITNKFFEGLRDHHFKRSGASTDWLLPKLTSLSYTGKKDFTWPAFLKMFPPPGNVLVTGRPLSEVSLKLYLPKAVIGDHDVIAKLREIQQSKIKLVVMNLDGKDLL